MRTDLTARGFNFKNAQKKPKAPPNRHENILKIYNSVPLSFWYLPPDGVPRNRICDDWFSKFFDRIIKPAIYEIKR